MRRALAICVATLLLGAVLPGQQGYPQYPPSAPSQYPPASPPSNNPYPPQQGTAGDETLDQQHSAARISVMGGEVNLKRGDNSLVAAIVNAPLLSQDHLQTGPSSSVEVQLDGANVIRLAENTDVGFASLQYEQAQMQLGAGTVIVRALRPSQGQMEVQTPSIAVRPVGAADLRISVFGDGTTQVSVRAGAAEMQGPQGSEQLRAGQSVLVRGNPDAAEVQETALPPHDGLDDWSGSRDAALQGGSGAQYTGGDMAGVADLDANGSWVPSEYGQVWTPRAPAAGWAPYSDGRWAYEPYYGWTWVDAAPWGWAPYHYGRWFLNGGLGWCWWPGGIGVRHFWGPAFVGFFGWGGGLGWVALAPHEGFHAWWGGGGWRGGVGFGFGGGYGRGFAGGGVLGLYRNAGVRGGAITASYGSFAGPGARFSFASREMMARANVISGRLPVNPGAGGYRLSNRAAVSNPRLAGVENRRFFQPSRSGFYGNASGVRSGSAGSFGRPAGVSAARPQYRPSSSSAGWQRFGDPRASASFRQEYNNGGSGNRESGWHQFGQPGRAAGPAPQPSYRQPARPYASPQQSYRAQPSAPPSYRPSAPPQSSYRQAAPQYNQQPRSASPSGSRAGGGGGGWGGGNRGGESHGGGGGGHSSSGSSHRR